MPSCRLYQKQLSSYLDGELEATRSARVEAHLRTCPHCRAELDALSGIGHRIRAASRGVRVSTDFDQRVLHSVGYWQVTGRPVQQRTLTKPLLAVAIALLAVLGLIWSYLTESAPPMEPVPQTPAAAVAPAPPITPASPDARRP